jgi:hypothetical protein
VVSSIYESAGVRSPSPARVEQRIDPKGTSPENQVRVHHDRRRLPIGLGGALPLSVTAGQDIRCPTIQADRCRAEV